MDLGNLESSDFFYYRLKMFINLGIAMAANALGFILIVWASPKHIQTYRWFLLNILFLAFCLDLYMMAIYQPFVIFPILGCCTLGILSTLGQFIGSFIGLYILIALLGFCAGSVLCAALFRLAAVYNCQNLLISQMGIFAMVGLHLFIPVPVYIALSFLVQELNGHMEEELRANYSQQYPNMRNIFSNEVCLVATVESQIVRITLLTAICTLVMIALLALSMIIMGFVTLHMRKATYSERLYKMHMQLSICLLVQISIPVVVILLPFLILVIGILFQFALLRDIMEAYLLVFSMHSTLNAFAMIMFTRPYRDAVKKWLIKFRIVKFIAVQIRGNSVSQMTVAEDKELNVQTANPLAVEEEAVAKGRQKSANANANANSHKFLPKISS